MQKDDLILNLKSFFSENYIKYYIDIAFLYGSWAGGYPRKDSDIDLAVLFSKDIKEEQEKFFLITDISYDLEKKIKREVNIISISWEFTHPMLYYNAIVLGVPIFVKDPDRYLDLKLESLFQMEDFQIFGTKWQYRVAQNLLRR